MPANLSNCIAAVCVCCLCHLQAGITAGTAAFAFENNDHEPKLAALNPPVSQMVAALNVVLAENGEKIVTREDFELFLEQIEEWE